MLGQQELEVAAKVMQALAHPLRLAIMQALVEKDKSVTELYEELDVSQSMMSQQLKILESQGLITSHKEGTVKHCSIQNHDFLNLFSCMKKHLELYFKV